MQLNYTEPQTASDSQLIRNTSHRQNIRFQEQSTVLHPTSYTYAAGDSLIRINFYTDLWVMIRRTKMVSIRGTAILYDLIDSVNCVVGKSFGDEPKDQIRPVL